MVQLVAGSMPHGGPIEICFIFEPVLHNWGNKGYEMCYSFCEMVHIKDP